MTCPSCTAAETNPHTGRFTAHCRQCEARAIAQSPQFLESRIAKRRTHEYQHALSTVFGVGEEDAGHELVKAWALKIQEHKEHTA